MNSLTEEDKASLQEALAEYSDSDLADEKTKPQYVPVWLDDKVAHGHYDGYCKESTSISFYQSVAILR